MGKWRRPAGAITALLACLRSGRGTLARAQDACLFLPPRGAPPLPPTPVSPSPPPSRGSLSAPSAPVPAPRPPASAYRSAAGRGEARNQLAARADDCDPGCLAARGAATAACYAALLFLPLLRLAVAAILSSSALSAPLWLEAAATTPTRQKKTINIACMFLPPSLLFGFVLASLRLPRLFSSGAPHWLAHIRRCLSR